MLTDYKCDSHMLFQSILPGATKYKKNRKVESVELGNNEVRIEQRTVNDSTSIQSAMSESSSTNSSISTSIDNNKEGEASSNEALGNGSNSVQPRSAVAAASIGDVLIRESLLIRLEQTKTIKLCFGSSPTHDAAESPCAR
jgi:hypothetical protein